VSNQPIKILLIEDNPEDIQLMRQALAEEQDTPFTLTHADRLSTGLESFTNGDVDLVLLDLSLPDSKGIGTLVRVHERAPHVPIVVLTASDDEALAVQALQRGAEDYLVKGDVHVYPHLLGRSLRYAIERKRTEEQLRNVHAQTETLLALLPSILIGVSPAGLVTHWNAVAESTFGIAASEVINRPLSKCGIRWDAGRVLERLASCRNTNTPSSLDDVSFTRADGQEGFVGITFIPVRGEVEENVGVLLFGADVTERKQAETERSRLQEQLLQAQKMETIGRFAGGIAHDFNNFLQVILGFAWLIRARYRDDQELISDMQEIVHAAESASGMVRQLLAFSRRQPLQLKALEINQTIRNMERLLQQLVGEHVLVDLQLAPTPLVVKLDPTGLEQILMNLCANARDSMQQGGTLTIRTQGITVDEAFLETRPWWTKKGDYVQLSIQDTGTGMDPSVATHVFEPFFTTKQLGKGTGLGLAVVYGLVKQHEGLIDIETAPGEGATFHLYFPYQDLQVGEPGGGLPEICPTRRRGTEAILVVENNNRQRALDAEVLRESGYRVVGDCDGAGAVELFTQCAERVEVVILDASILSRISREALQHLRSIRPDMRVLLIRSGSVDEQPPPLGSSLGVVQILEKPYLPAQLLERLRQLLDQPLAPTPAGEVALPTVQKAKKRVLVVDDDLPIRYLCERIFKESYQVTAVSSGRAALEALGREPYDILLTDLRMPNMDGAALLEEATKLQPALKLLAMTGSLSSELELRLRSVSLSAEVIRKPFAAPTLLEIVNRCLS
jgi:PAS domain S-box-containing protein